MNERPLSPIISPDTPALLQVKGLVAQSHMAAVLPVGVDLSRRNER